MKNALAQSSTINSSVASSHLEYVEDYNYTRIKNEVKETLRARIFLGRYIERRLINQSIGYRDIVVISTAETELKKDLLEAQHKLSYSCPKISWIGITDTDTIACNPSGSVCLCTEIDNQPFGAFWFQIKSIRFRDDEIIILLKCLRHITEAFIELEPILSGTKENKVALKAKPITTVALEESFSDIVVSLKSALSIRNVKEFFTFLCAFIIAIFTGSTAFVNFLGNFILALIRELSILVQNSTPMFLGVLDFCSKIVGGFYILLAMVFKQKTPIPVNSRSLMHYNHVPNQKAYSNYDGQFD